MGGCCSTKSKQSNKSPQGSPGIELEQTSTRRAIFHKPDPSLDGKDGAFSGPRDVVLREERPLLAISRRTNFDVSEIRNLQVAFESILARVTLKLEAVEARKEKSRKLLIPSGKSPKLVRPGSPEIESYEAKLSEAGMRVAMGLSSDDHHPLAGPLFRIFDSTKTSQINFRTWASTLSILSRKASAKQKIEFAWSLLDPEQKGAVDVSGLKTLLQTALQDLSLFDMLDESEQNAIVEASVAQVKQSNGSSSDGHKDQLVHKSEFERWAQRSEAGVNF